MGIGAHDVGTTKPDFAEHQLRRLSRFVERIGLALLVDRGIVELMTAHGDCKWRVVQRLENAIPQMQFSIGKARAEREETGHRMFLALLVDYAVTEHHEAAALAIDQRGGGSESRQELSITRKPSGMEFRVAARQEDSIC